MAKSSIKKAVLWIFLLLLLVPGFFIYRRFIEKIEVTGYLDAAQKIPYVAAEIEDTEGRFAIVPLWNGNYTTQSEIEYYVETSRVVGQELLDAGVQDFYVGVTFRNYMPPREFEEWVSRLDVNVKQYAIRSTLPTLDPQDRWTAFGGGRLVSPTSLQSLQNSLEWRALEIKRHRYMVQRRKSGEDKDAILNSEEYKRVGIAEGDVVINGIYTFEAITDRDGYKRLMQDPHVFHVDVTATLAYQQLRWWGYTWEGFVSEPDLNQYTPFWDMETIGLEEFD